MECDVRREEFEAASEAAVRCVQSIAVFVLQFTGRARRTSFGPIRIFVDDQQEKPHRQLAQILLNIRALCLDAEKVCTKLDPQLRAAGDSLGGPFQAVRNSDQLDHDHMIPAVRTVDCVAGSNHLLACKLARSLWGDIYLKSLKHSATWPRNLPIDYFAIDTSAVLVALDDVEAAMQTFPAFDHRMMVERMISERNIVLRSLPPVENGNGHANRNGKAERSIDPAVSPWDLEAGGYIFKGKWYALTGKPLDLLRVFVKHSRQQTFSLAEMREAWPEDNLVEDGAVRTQLHALRNEMRALAKKTNQAKHIIKDPIPPTRARDGNSSWRFLLPR